MRVSALLSDTSHRRRISGSLDLMPDGSVGLMFGVLTRAPCGGPKECPHFTSPDNGRKIEGVPCLWEGAQPRPLVREEFPVDWFSPFGSLDYLWASSSPCISAETKRVNSVPFSHGMGSGVPAHRPLRFAPNLVASLAGFAGGRRGPTHPAAALRSRPPSGSHRLSPGAPRSPARYAAKASAAVPGLSFVVFFLRSRRCVCRRMRLPPESTSRASFSLAGLGDR